MNTQDFSKFGYRELAIAADLIKAYLKHKSLLDDGVRIEFNPSSGDVFLVDEDYKVACMNGENLELWLYCPNCGHEDFKSEFLATCNEDECCVEYFNEIEEN